MATAPYKDATEDRLASASGKLQNTMNHFQLFLDNYLPSIVEDVIEAEEIPYKGLGLPRRPSPKDTNEFWSKMMGCFVDYLSSATHYNNPNKQLAESSADGFFSSIKEFYTTKFRSDPSLNVFQDPQWGKLRDKLKGKFRESDRGKPRKKKPSSTRNDRELIAKAVFWEDSASSAEFLPLLNSAFHFSARGSEVALIKASTTAFVEATESVYRCFLLQVECQRHKNGPYHELQVHPDADGVLEDWYFSLIYLLVMTGCDNENMFPRCSDAASSMVDGNSKSTVPALWKSDFDKLLKSLDEMRLLVNRSLRSHCNKRGSQQLCAESPAASGLSQHFRTGWQSAANTMLKCICGSTALERPAAKAVAKWPARDGCGQPVGFDDILASPSSPSPPPTPPSSPGFAVAFGGGESEKLHRFTDVLFEDDKNGLWDQKVRELLVSTLLLRWNQFCDVLRSHPAAYVPDLSLKNYDPQDERFDLEKSYEHNTIQDNKFVCKVKQALVKAEVHELLFRSWCESAHNAFLTRNIDGIPIQNFSLHGSRGGKEVLLDPRRFTDHFNQLVSMVQSTHIIAQELRHRLNDLTEIVNADRMMRSYDTGKFTVLANAVQKLATHLLPETESRPSSPVPKGVNKFSVMSKDLGDAPVWKVVTDFFVDNFLAGFTLDKKAWKDNPDDYSKGERRKLSQRFSSMKCGVKMILLHAPSFPSPLSKQSITQMAKLAEEKLRHDLGFNKQETITHGKIQKHPKTAELQANLSLPPGLPDKIKDFFSKTDKTESA